MRIIFLSLLSTILFSFSSSIDTKLYSSSDYLKECKIELKKQWPNNRTINLVFHGHSVPSGYFNTPTVNTLESYPFLLLKKLKELYPYAVINSITTSIGGENSTAGANRFESDVLIHKPDVIFIDYALNDRSIGLEKSYSAWNSMIKKAMEQNIKVILLTPSPDLSLNITESNNDLNKHSLQIKELAKKFNIGLADNYEQFKQKALNGDDLSTYMSQVNHPNFKGHELIANELLKFFQ